MLLYKFCQVRKPASLEDFCSRLEGTHLPTNIEHFHSLVPLDLANQKSAASFGFNSWLYKAVSSKDGLTYALRRIEGMVYPQRCLTLH